MISPDVRVRTKRAAAVALAWGAMWLGGCGDGSATAPEADVKSVQKGMSSGVTEDLKDRKGKTIVRSIKNRPGAAETPK